MHLTNYAVNKGNPNFESNDVCDENEGGHKRSLKWLYTHLAENGHNIHHIKQQINDMIVKTLCSV
jgi:tubulin polyglutamylase TTLL6/13